MADISLRPVTADNWRPIVKLKLADEQKNWVAPNWYSVLEAIYEDNLESRAIYDGDEPVGYVLFGKEADANKHWIIRLMIDIDHQKKGYGRAAMVQIIDLMQSHYKLDAIYISFVPGNDVARKLYEQLGFVDTGEMEEGEHIFKLPL